MLSERLVSLENIMRKDVLENVRKEITEALARALEAEGIKLYIAVNDNMPSDSKAVILEGIEDTLLFCDKLVTEIRVCLGIIGKSSYCDALMETLYNCLHPYNLTFHELNVLLMSMHVESCINMSHRRIHKKTVMRYIIEENA